MILGSLLNTDFGSSPVSGGCIQGIGKHFGFDILVFV